MCRRISIWTVIACILLFFAGTGWADVPPPPVNQDIGMPDIAFGNMTEADCRVCHDSGVPDRHHLLYGQDIPPGSLVPYPDGTVYVCLSCHDQDFTVVRDCAACHIGSSPHHHATGRDCATCHGDLVDNFDDGHYVPTYSPSLVTPSPGDCGNCHASGGNILSNIDLHHGTGLMSCAWCHDMTAPDNEKIRRCEDCHGPDSLHNIQADSLATGNIGTIVVGGEDAGYGHVGRDAGPGDSDCWGCHGFAAAALAPFSGPLVPTVNNSSRAVVKAGTDTLVVLSGSAITNTVGKTLFESDGVLTAADGSSVTLKPDAVGEMFLAVTIPGNTAPGNYNLQAVKTDDAGDPVASNPAVISIVPEVIITNVTSDGIVTIEGNGFGGYAEGSGTSVTGKTGTTTVEATIVSWSDTIIKADFGAASPEAITVNSVFGTDTYPD